MRRERVVRRRLPLVLLFSLLAVLSFLAAPAASSAGAGSAKPVPLIFVHGHNGSAQQFETNAMRFDSNGYGKGRIFVYEYDTSGSSNDLAIANLDPFIAKVQARTGASQVDVLAHSRGTSVMHSFLETPARAANVRRYVNFDGRSADSQPGGVPTIAIWGEGNSDREITGAENVYFPEKAHTEVTTSRPAFAAVYEFLNGEPPETKAITAEDPSKVKVRGRALDFPNNLGMKGRTLEVYELQRSTGQRKPGGPVFTKELGYKGNFGPFAVNGSKRYEFTISDPEGTTLHNYPEPFEHDDHFYRVLDAPLLVPFIERSPDSSSVAVTRMREFWGDQPGADKLEFNGFEVINPATAPRDRRVIAVFNFDAGSDQTSDTSASLFPFNAVPFLTGVDNFMPSSADASGRIQVKETIRGRHVEKTNVPNWPSDAHTVSVFFKDYVAKEYRGR